MVGEDQDSRRTPRLAFMAGWSVGLTACCIKTDPKTIHGLEGKAASAFEEGFELGRGHRACASLESDLWDFR